jgi:hypothetical protein
LYLSLGGDNAAARTVKARGLTIPANMLALADEVTE